MTTKPDTEQEPTPEQTVERLLKERQRQLQSERARVAKFMGCSINKVVRGRDGGWTTR